MNKITFLISCIVVVASILRWGHVSKKKQHQVAHIQHNQSIPVKYEAGVVALLMLLAIVLRLYQFGSIPGGMNQDGAMAAVDAKALSQYGTDRFGTYMPVHFTAWGYGQMSVFLSYCMVPFIKFFGLSPVTARLPVLIFSMAGLGAIYFIIRSVLGIEAALIALILAIINPWHFVQSRWALDCNMLPHVFVLAFALLVWGIYKIKKLGVYISMAIFGLCMYCYGVALYTVPVFLFVIALYMIKEKVLTIREVLISAGVFLLISGPFILTMAINTFGWNTIRTPFFTMPCFPDSVRSADILFFADDKLAQLKVNIYSTLLVCLRGDDLLWNTLPGFGVINICFLPFVLLGIYYVIYLSKNDTDATHRVGYMSLLVFFATGILCGLITKAVNVNRINILHYSLIIFAASGIYFSYINLKRLSYVLLPVWCVLSISFLHYYFTDYASRIKEIFSEDYIEAVEYVSDVDCKHYVLSPCAKEGVNPQLAEIVTMFALDIDANYYQGKTVDEDGLTYLEKYTYDFAQHTDIENDGSTAYVIMEDELYLFSEDDYFIAQFGRFYALTPR